MFIHGVTNNGTSFKALIEPNNAQYSEKQKNLIKNFKENVYKVYLEDK